MSQPIVCTFVLMQRTFTNLLSDLYKVRIGLSEQGIRLTNDQVLSLILIKEFMSAEGRVSVKKREVYEGTISKTLGFSRSTFHRAVDGLVRNRCLLPMGARKEGGWIGVGEHYRLSMVSKMVDAILGMANAA